MSVRGDISKFGPLYVITHSEPLAADELTRQIEAVLRGGARLIQWRRKGPGVDPRTGLAAARAACAQHGACFIVNDDLDLAGECAADGVHLGREDTDIEDARRALGGHALIGVSCYDSLESARAAAADGADYLAFGSVYPSPTKPTASACPIDVLRRARGEFDLPLCAIGGIERHNLAPLVSLGVDLLAVISAVFGSGDCERATRELVAALAPRRPAHGRPNQED